MLDFNGNGISGDDSSFHPMEGSTSQSRFGFSLADFGNDDMVWKQAIDVNGDGRLDIINAKETALTWVVYLNTPDPADPKQIVWKRRTYAVDTLMQQLRDRGLRVDANFLPLSRRHTERDRVDLKCWLWNGFAWVKDPNGSQPDGSQPDESKPDGSPGISQPCTGFPVLPEITITEWKVTDLNGDGYLDVVSNSSPVVPLTTADPFPEDPGVGERFIQGVRTGAALQAGNANRIDAVFNVLGVHIDVGSQPFSAPVTLRSNEGCGVARWFTPTVESNAPQQLTCDLVDINGDGIADRVNDSSVFLGKGGLGTGGFFTASAMPPVST